MRTIKNLLLFLFIIFTVNINKSYGQNIITVGNDKISQRNMPCNGFFDYNWSALMYRQNEINSEGYISKIYFEVDNSADIVLQNQKIYIALTSETAFENGNKPDVSKMLLVYSGDILFSKSGWQEIILNTPFYYDNKKNIVIYYENFSGKWSEGYAWFNSTNTANNNLTLYSGADFAFPTGIGTLSNLRPNVKFEFSKNAVANNKFECYPNPATSDIHINYDGNSNAELLISNIYGQVLIQKPISAQAQELIDLKEFSKGIYNVCIQNDEGIEIRKIILE
ncbi:MAG: T9SS type A sorting domain-containing protein [Bacteroidales bacterium]|jgi:hypothetical protein